MTAAQDAIINQYMSRNGVSLYAPIPWHFRPMAALRMQSFEYSATGLALAFFGGTDDVIPMPSFYDGQTVYRRGTEELMVNGSRFTYKNNAPNDEFVLTRETAIDICKQFVSKHEKLLGSHVMDRHMVRETRTRDGFSITFNGKFRDRLVTSNTLVFHVTDGGIARVDGIYYEPVGLVGNTREIISPVEALYLFVRAMNYIYDDREVIVDGMELVYHLAEVTTDSSIPLNATPYYRFWLFYGEEQVMINAYTGGVLDGFF